MVAMSATLKRRLAAGAAGLALVASGAVAVAATTGGGTTKTDRRAEFLADVAKRLNVTTDQLEAALKGARDDQLDAAVKAGKLTQEQADRLKQLPAGAGPGFGFGPGGPGLRGGHGPHGFGRGPGMGGKGFVAPGLMRGAFKAAATAASDYLGLSKDQLKQQVMSGKSLADIAKAQNKDVAGLKAKLQDVAKDQLAKAVSSKAITQAQADRFQKLVDEHLDDAINGTFEHGLGMHRHGMHP